MVFAKNEDGGILPQSRRVQRNAAIAKGYAEANKNYQAYSDDLKVLKDLNKQLDNNGQVITDNEQRMAKANEATKNASQRAKDYGKQIATNAKTLTDFKRENEVEKPDQQKQGKWSDGLKSMASAGLSMIGNAFISAGVGMLVQGAFSLLGKGIDAFVHKNENLIAKGQEAKESIQSQTKAYEDQKASLGELTAKYTELSKGVKISGNSIKNISLTDDEYKDFLDTSNQIAAAAPSLTRSWDSQGNAILNAGTNAEDLNTRGIEQNVNDLFTTTSDGIKLNIDALKTFTEYQAEATDGDFEKGIKLQTKAIKDQTDVTNKAKKAWKEAKGTEDEDDKKAAYDSEKDKLKDARNEYLSYMQSQSEWQATKKQQQELLSYYSQWQRAQSTENAGDKYNNIVAGLKNAKDAYDKGLVGTDDFKSFAALISPTGSDDRANFAENYGKAVRYLTEDKTGVNNFLADLKSKGMASYDDASKRWSFDIDDMSKAARSMGISKEFMSANFGRLRDYGIDNNFISSIEEGIDRTQELTSALSDEQKRLEELKNTDSTNTTAISASEDKVNKYKQDLKETYDNMESYSEDAAQNAIDNFNSSAMGAQAYEEEIKRVQKNDQLTNDQRNAAINQLKAKQEELAASAGTTVEALLGTDVSSLMDGIITDSASVSKYNRTQLDGIYTW